jgi:hypothetical protein
MYVLEKSFRLLIIILEWPMRYQDFFYNFEMTNETSSNIQLFRVNFTGSKTDFQK